MTNTTLTQYFNVLYTMKQNGEITENQMKQYADIIFYMVEEDGFNETHVDDVFVEIRKNIEKNVLV